MQYKTVVHAINRSIYIYIYIRTVVHAINKFKDLVGFRTYLILKIMFHFITWTRVTPFLWKRGLY